MTRWFNQLNHNQKIIALTVALFNGLFCRQYFEVLSEMIDRSFWRQNVHTLEALDYFNLDFLRPFFRIENTDEGDLIIAENPKTRIHLLKAAKFQYPRHIHRALEIFSDIMQSSYARNNTNWGLYGTTHKRALLRQVFIGATRDIGINALSNVESIYLELAASNQKFIQGIAAKSMAQYRLLNEDDLLFETLNKWLTDKSVERRIELFLQKASNTNQTISAIKATTIRALAYAADYDRPNELHSEIVTYLITFAKDNSDAVQDAVADVLSKFIIHHTLQLRNEIFDSLMPNVKYGPAISEGLLKGYKNYPEALKEVINHWLSICMKEHSKENRREKTTFRDNALISIINTLGRIDMLENGFTLKDLYDISSELLKTEKRPAVIAANLNLIAHIQQHDYTMAYDYIPETIEKLTRKQRKEMVRHWTFQFIQQRKNLRNGQFTITVFEEEFPAWDKMRSRPLTILEETLFLWLNSKSKVAQKFATLTFLDIAHFFEIEEHQQILKYEVQRQERRMNLLKSQK